TTEPTSEPTDPDIDDAVTVHVESDTFRVRFDFVVGPDAPVGQPVELRLGFTGGLVADLELVIVNGTGWNCAIGVISSQRTCTTTIGPNGTIGPLTATGFTLKGNYTLTSG